MNNLVSINISNSYKNLGIKVADLLLTPARRLFGGRTVTGYAFAHPSFKIELLHVNELAAASGFKKILYGMLAIMATVPGILLKSYFIQKENIPSCISKYYNWKSLTEYTNAVSKENSLFVKAYNPSTGSPSAVSVFFDSPVASQRDAVLKILDRHSDKEGVAELRNFVETNTLEEDLYTAIEAFTLFLFDKTIKDGYPIKEIFTGLYRKIYSVEEWTDEMQNVAQTIVHMNAIVHQLSDVKEEDTTVDASSVSYRDGDQRGKLDTTKLAIGRLYHKGYFGQEYRNFCLQYYQELLLHATLPESSRNLLIESMRLAVLDTSIVSQERLDGLLAHYNNIGLGAYVTQEFSPLN